MTAFSGVRSSWDMLARNSDLCRLATSSSADLVSSSRKSRALTIATDDWSANVSSSSTTSSANVPTDRRRMTRTPTITEPRSIGMASTDRQPSSRRHRQVAVHRGLLEVLDLEGATLGRRPADEGVVPPDDGGAQPLDQLRAAPVGGPDDEGVALARRTP